MERKPLIVWTCDVPGWAYHNRIVTMRRAMPQFEHRVLYFGGAMCKALRRRLLADADIIVCQGVKSLRVVDQIPLDIKDCSVDEAKRRAYKKVVVRVDSMRVDINGQYVDIFAKA